MPTDLDALRRKIRRRVLRDEWDCEANVIVEGVNDFCDETPRAVSVRPSELDVEDLHDGFMHFICDTHLDMRLDQLYAEEQGSH